MIVLGLTGGVAMGKSAVASMFAEQGAASANADQIVHQLLSYDPDVIAKVEARFPAAVRAGLVDRKKLGEMVFGNAAALGELEAILHPRVVAEEEAFVEQARREGKWLVVLDIPLLFETGAEGRCDYVAVVSASAEVQRARALERPNMTLEKLQRIIALQMPDGQKRERADFVIPTDVSKEETFRHVQDVVNTLKKEEQRRGGNA